MSSVPKYQDGYLNDPKLILVVPFIGNPKFIIFDSRTSYKSKPLMGITTWRGGHIPGFSRVEFARLWSSDDGQQQAADLIGRIAIQIVRQRRPELPEVDAVRIVLEPTAENQTLRTLFEQFGQERVATTIAEIKLETIQQADRELCLGIGGDYYQTLWQRERS